MSVPSSVIHVMSGVPLNNSYEHSLYFPSKELQFTYFAGYYRVKTFDNYTYLRPGNVIKVAGDVANARSWNYLMFQNDTGKWYYHFITKVVYLNDSAVELHIELDVIQTYMFDWDLKQCFIERMHTETDVFGEHTIPEGLETGPLMSAAVSEINLEDNYIILLMSATKDGGQAWGSMYGGVYSGLNAYAVDPADMTEFNEWLSGASTEGYIDSIVSMWMYPKELVSIMSGQESNTLKKVSGIHKNVDKVVEDPISTTINGYTVKNQKTLCYPYTMLYVSNNMGGCATYQRELFAEGGEYTFNLRGALAPDSGVELTPRGYKTPYPNSFSFEHSLSLPAFPSCAWNSDTYKVWLAQNQNTQALAQRQAVIQAGVGVVGAGVATVSGNIGGALGGLATTYHALTSVQSLMAQKADMAIQPDQARGNHSGNINLTHGRQGFSCYFMTITKEYAKIIDNYFTRYGYKVNTVAVPKLKTRETFTYVKTQGCTVTGSLGAEDQLKVQAIFDKGITFWNDPADVGNYNLSNKPL